jgi:methyl-accepting chemotaxis protein
MNKSRRKQLTTLITTIDELRQKFDDLVDTANELVIAIEEAKSEIETVKDEEQEAYDNMPESLQNGDRGQVVQQAIDSMEEASGNLDVAVEALNNLESSVSIQDVVTALETASE